MIFDIVFALVLLNGIREGFRDGLIHTLFSAIGYVAGAIGGLYFALQYNHSAWVLLAIAIGAGLGSFAGRLLARGLKITIVRGPLAWINAVAGVAFEAIVISVVGFLVGTALLWAPWPTGQNQISESKVYLKLNTYMPHFLSTTFSTITKEFEKAI
jgi:hypothetical protein